MYEEGDLSISVLLLGLSLAGFLFGGGSAVTGLFISGRRAGRIGRTGADDKEPMVDMAVAGLAILEKAAGFMGVAEGSAEPGRSGRTFPDIFARFCAAMVSLIDGFGGREVVLLEKAWGFTPGGAIETSGSF